MKILSNGIAVIAGDPCISKWVEETGRLDHDRTLDLLAQYIPPSAVIVDAGAYIGDHTIAYARNAERVIAFEPNPDAFDCLVHNLRNHSNVVPVNAGLSDRHGVARLHQEAGNAGASYLSADGVEVKLLPLDSFKFSRLDFFKIDVEGHEPRVLSGAEQTIRRHRPTMFIEVNVGALERAGSSATALIAMVESLGYVVSTLSPLPDDAPQWDILAKPK